MICKVLVNVMLVAWLIDTSIGETGFGVLVGRSFIDSYSYLTSGLVQLDLGLTTLGIRLNLQSFQQDQILVMPSLSTYKKQPILLRKRHNLIIPRMDYLLNEVQTTHLKSTGLSPWYIIYCSKTKSRWKPNTQLPC